MKMAIAARRFETQLKGGKLATEPLNLPVVGIVNDTPSEFQLGGFHPGSLPPS